MKDVQCKDLKTPQKNANKIRMTLTQEVNLGVS